VRKRTVWGLLASGVIIALLVVMGAYSWMVPVIAAMGTVIAAVSPAAVLIHESWHRVPLPPAAAAEPTPEDVTNAPPRQP
jgi:hypothetical protein